MQLLGITLNKNRVYGLDILRAIAILTVVYVHGSTYAVQFLPQKVYNLFAFDGVSAFFVLSGFLIGGILIKTLNNAAFKRKDLVNFWVRRWFRTIPNYVLILVTLVIIYKATGQSIHKVYLYPFFLQTALRAEHLFFAESWSLTIEEWFYFLVPITLYFFIKVLRLSVKSSLLVSIVSIILLCTLIRVYRFYTIEFTDFRDIGVYIRRVLITRLDSIMYGVLGAYVYHYHKVFWEKNKKLFFVIGLLILFYKKVFYMLNGFNTPEFSASFNDIVLEYARIPIGVLFTLPFLNSIKSGKGFVYKFVTYISLISYALYVVHLSVVKVSLLPHLRRMLLHSMGIKAQSASLYLLFWIISILLATLIFKYFEKPMMDLRNRFSSKTN